DLALPAFHGLAFAKARAHDEPDLGSHIGAALDGIDCSIARYRDDGHLGTDGQGFKIRIARHSLHGLARGIDRHELPTKAEATQVIDRAASHLVSVLGSAYDRNGTRVQSRA